jgi:predicted dehydrogenase
MRFLIAGLGSIGRRHLRNLQTLGERDVVLYHTGRSSLPEDELSGYAVETDLNAALAYHPDAVIVANPTALHLEVAIPAARAGCSLLLEKPVSNSLDGLEELQKALDEGGGKAVVGFQFRFNPGLRKAAEVLAQGRLGVPLSARAHWGEYLPAWHPWEDYRRSYSARKDLGGGVVLTLCHPLDYLRWLLGEVQSLWAFAGHLSELQIGVEDTAEIGLRFANGSLASVHLDYNQQPPQHYMDIVCSGGTLRWTYANAALRVFDAQLDLWESFLAPIGFERNTMFMDELRHFIDVARGTTEPLCTLEDGRRALELALSALSSAREGRQVTF